MKKLYTFLFLILFLATAFSQEKIVTKGLRIENHTKCTQFVVIEWGDNCNCLSGNGGGTSDIIKIVPNDSMDVFEEGYVSANMFIIAAKVGGGYYCSGSNPVGQPCSLHPLTAQYIEYIKYDEDCKECTQTLAKWKPVDCKSPAILTFTNP